MAGGQKTIVAELSRTIEGVKSGLDDLQKSLSDLQKSSTGWTQSLISGLRQSQSQLEETKRGFDKLSGAIQRASAVPGVVSGARISQALGASTGQSVGGGGGGAQPFASQFARTALSPLRFGLPMMAGALAQLPFAAAGGALGGAGGALSKLPIAGKLLKGLGGAVGGLGRNVARPMVEGAVHMGLGFGTQYIQQAMSMREQMERSGRFLGRGGESMIGRMATTGLRHGYDVMQTMSHREAMGRAIGGPTPQEGALQAMSNRLRQPIGSIAGAARSLRGGGMNADAIVGVLQRIEGGVERAGFGRETPAFMHRTESLLEAISGFSAQQVALSGRVVPGQTTAFQNMVQALSTGRGGGPGEFSPQEAARKAQQLLNIRMNPGGGEAGELFVQRALGFGSPDLEAQKRAMIRIGGNPNLVRRRTVFEQQRLRDQNPMLSDQLIRAQLEADYSGGDEMQAWQAQVLSRGALTFSAAEGALGSLSGGIPNRAQQIVQGAGAVGRGGTKGMMGIDPKMITVLNEYHKNLANLAGVSGGLEGLTGLAELIRTLQQIGGGGVSTILDQFFAPITKDILRRLKDGNFEEAIKTEIQAIAAIIKKVFEQIGVGGGNQ